MALPKLRPAEGFEAIIVWSGEPKDRALLFAPPVDALWDAEAGDLDRPIEVVLQVDALGNVVNSNVSSLNVAAQERMCSINNAFAVDLTGQICAESLGTVVYNGTGGQPEFHIGAFIAPKGKAITVTPSAAANARRFPGPTM